MSSDTYNTIAETLVPGGVFSTVFDFSVRKEFCQRQNRASLFGGRLMPLGWILFFVGTVKVRESVPERGAPP